MHVTYTPEDGDRLEWDVELGRIRAGEAEMMERRYGDTYEAWTIGVQRGAINARRVLLWHLLRLAHPTFRWEDVPDFYADELLVEYSVKELTGMRDRVAKASMEPREREQAMAALDVEITKAMEREVAAAGGKAPAAPPSAT